MDEPSKAPTGLRAPGKLLWAAVIDKYVLTAAEVEMLGQACRTTDELDRLERAVRVLPELTTTGSTGQLKPHPLLEEVRRHRTLLERLTTALALPDEDQTVGLRGASRHAQRRREPVGAAVGEECLMAMHRRPPGVEPPAELFEFRLEEWQAPDDLDWEAAFQRWTTARRAWVAEHPDSALGNRLDLLRGERRARFRNLGWHQSDVSRLRGV